MMIEYVGAGGGTGGDRTPILKFSAKDGSFVAADRIQVDGQWQTQERELDVPIKVVMDMAELEMGWIAFKPAPDFLMVKAGQPRPEKPSDEHKWGFRVKLANKDIGLRELSSSSKNVYQRMVPVFQAWEAGKAENAGKVPIVEISGTDRVVQQLNDGSSQTWRVPTWSITGWTDRPEMLDGATASAPAQAAPVPASLSPAEAGNAADLF